MTVTPELRAAFRWHMQKTVYRHGVYEYPEGKAAYCLQLARADVAAGKALYPGPVRPHPPIYWGEGVPHTTRCVVSVEAPESIGLRYVGRVSIRGRRGVFSTNDSEGWLTDPHGNTYRDGTGLCWGVVYQMPTRRGELRFVAGYQMGGVEGGPVIDFETIYRETPGPDNYTGDMANRGREMDAAQNAARAADHLAMRAAETEREYQCAYRAGNRWAQHRADAATIRAEIIEILKERRAIKGAPGYPALCRAIRDRVSDLLAELHRRREKMATLAAGRHSLLGFFSADKDFQDAFCDGAELDAFPG